MLFLQPIASHSLRTTAIRNTRHILHSRQLFTRPTTPRSPLHTGLYATIFALSTGLFAVYYFDARSAMHRYIISPLIQNALDPETAHKLAVKVLKSGLAPKDPVKDIDRLSYEIWGEKVTNPIGVAAGFDKDGEAIDGLFDLGFSWVEIGSVTPKPQSGNPRPRVFRLPEDEGLINRHGFPSQGHASVLSRLRARLPTFGRSDRPALRDGSLLAVNLGKNKESPAESVDDFVEGVRTFGPYVDALVVNVSSPNTPGLRGLQNHDLLKHLLSSVVAAREELTISKSGSHRPKLLLKLAPDLDEQQLVDIAEVIRESKIDGVIVSNTTIQRPAHLMNANKHETGGLSGTPVKSYSLKALRTLRTQLPASIPLIGCGGIKTGADALEYAKSGAAMVQVYTAFGYDGVGTCRRIKDQLASELERDGTTWSDVVKKSIEELSLGEVPPPVTGKSEISVHQLISEAEGLHELLDKLGEKMEVDEDAIKNTLQQ